MISSHKKTKQFMKTFKINKNFKDEIKELIEKKKKNKKNHLHHSFLQ
jgi:hypothetical protein